MQDEIIKYLHQGLRTSGAAWSLQYLGTRTLISCDCQQWQKPEVGHLSASDWIGHRKVVGHDLLWWRNYKKSTLIQFKKEFNNMKIKLPKFVVDFGYFDALLPAGLSPFFGFESWSVTPWGSIQSWRTANTTSSILLFTCQSRKNILNPRILKLWTGSNLMITMSSPESSTVSVISICSTDRFDAIFNLIKYRLLKQKFKYPNFGCRLKMCLLFLAVSKRIHKLNKADDAVPADGSLFWPISELFAISLFSFKKKNKKNVHVRDKKKTFKRNKYSGTRVTKDLVK